MIIQIGKLTMAQLPLSGCNGTRVQLPFRVRRIENPVAALGNPEKVFLPMYRKQHKGRKLDSVNRNPPGCIKMASRPLNISCIARGGILVAFNSRAE